MYSLRSIKSISIISAIPSPLPKADLNYLFWQIVIMKFSDLSCSLLAFAAGTEACIRVHAYLNNDPVTGDSMGVKIYDGYDFKCRAGDSQYFASGETTWKFKCGEDDRYEVHLTGDGTKGTVWNHNAGYEGTLISKDHEHKSECRYRTGLNDRCAGYVSSDETTLWDGFGDCDDKLFKTGNCGDNECDISEDDVPCAVNYNGRCEPVEF